MKTLSIMYCFVFLIIISVSCGKVECDTDPSLYVSLYKLKPEEITSIKVNRCLVGSNFNTVLLTDSFLLEDSTRAEERGHSNVNNIGLIGKAINVTEDYDWEIILPLANKTYRIKDIKFNDDANRGGLGGGEVDHCINSGEYNLDGTTYKIEMTTYGTNERFIEVY